MDSKNTNSYTNNIPKSNKSESNKSETNKSPKNTTSKNNNSSLGSILSLSKKSTSKSRTSKKTNKQIEPTVVTSLIKPDFIFFFEGMGCDVNENKYKYFFANKMNISYDKLIIKCKIIKGISNIVKVSVGFKPLTNKAKEYLNEMIDEILTKANTHNVCVYGHSYGGMVVNRIAEKIIPHPISNTQSTKSEIGDCHYTYF